MTTLKKYMVYLDDGDYCFKIPVPAVDEEQARRYVKGNGEVIAVRDITDDFPISSCKVLSALKESGFGSTEICLIMYTLDATEICNPLL